MRVEVHGVHVCAYGVKVARLLDSNAREGCVEQSVFARHPCGEVRRDDLEHEPVVRGAEPIAFGSGSGEGREDPGLVLQVALAAVEVGEALVYFGEVDVAVVVVVAGGQTGCIYRSQEGFQQLMLVRVEAHRGSAAERRECLAVESISDARSVVGLSDALPAFDGVEIVRYESAPLSMALRVRDPAPVPPTGGRLTFRGVRARHR